MSEGCLARGAESTTRRFPHASTSLVSTHSADAVGSRDGIVFKVPGAGGELTVAIEDPEDESTLSRFQVLWGEDDGVTTGRLVGIADTYGNNPSPDVGNDKFTMSLAFTLRF